MDSFDKLAKRKDILLTLHGVNLNTFLAISCEDSHDTSTTDEHEFMTLFVNALQAYDQSKQCPCTDCIRNFVVRTRRLHRMLKEEA